jgi:repressor LexA
MEGLTDRQRDILKFIHQSTGERGFPPTIREIGTAMKIASTNGVNDHLRALEHKGYLKRTGQTSRSFVLTKLARQALGLTTAGAATAGNTVAVPLVGKVAAGAPILALEQAEDSVHIDSFLLGGGGREVFALRVKGESMIGDGILDGDYLFVRKTAAAKTGDIVVALIEDEATCKRFFPEGDAIRFQPSNPKMIPIWVKKSDFRSTMILGVVVGVYRQTAAAWAKPATSSNDRQPTLASPTPPPVEAT